MDAEICKLQLSLRQEIDRNEYLIALLRKAFHYVEFAPSAGELKEKIKKEISGRIDWGRFGWSYVDDAELCRELEDLGITSRIGDLRARVFALLDKLKHMNRDNEISLLKDVSKRKDKYISELTTYIAELQSKITTQVLPKRDETTELEKVKQELYETQVKLNASNNLIAGYCSDRNAAEEECAKLRENAKAANKIILHSEQIVKALHDRLDEAEFDTSETSIEVRLTKLIDKYKTIKRIMTANN